MSESMPFHSEQREPEPDWQRDAIVAELPAFRFSHTAVPGNRLLPYLRFYGLEAPMGDAGVEYRIGFLEAAGYRLAIHYYWLSQPRGTVFLFHGYLDHSGLYTRIIRHCLSLGMNVLIYDLPGHGLSSGKPTAIHSFREYQRILVRVLDAAREEAPGPWIGIGQSTGGAVLIDYMLSRRGTPDLVDFSGTILLAPLVRPVGFRVGRLAHALTRPFQDQWKRVFVANSNDSEFTRFLKEHDPLQAQAIAMAWLTALNRWVSQIEGALPVDADVAVVQGEQDGTVDWRHNLKVLRRKFHRVRLYQIPEGRHHLVNESEPILEQVLGAVSLETERILTNHRNH